MKATENITSKPDGYKRFIVQLNELNKILIIISASGDPALALYKSGAREIIFRFEALCRIYRSINNKKYFSFWYDEFKLIEDKLGQLDYNDAFVLEFSKYKKLPSDFRKYFSDKRSEAIKTLNIILKNKYWFGSDSNFEERFLKYLDEVNFSDRNDEREKIVSFFIKQIKKLKKNYSNGKLNFNDIENGVHSFRRKLRWLSIYTSSLNGLIQLKKKSVIPVELKKYLSDEIINSRFNMLPKYEKGIIPIYIQSVNFYSISFVIQEIGKLKDEGLKIIEVDKAILQSGIKDKKTIGQIKKTIFKNSKKTLASISLFAENLVDDFIYKDRILDRMIRDFKKART